MNYLKEYFRVFDLHNDLITSKKDYLNQLKSYQNQQNEIITAYFRGCRLIDNVVKDVDYYLKVKPKNCYLAFEDVGYNQVEKIETLLQYKPMYISLTWNGENILGYGCNFNNFDIKEKGKEIIKLANNYKVAVDTAHVSRKGFFTIIDKADNVLCSHTAINSIYEHKRNLTDEQIRLIIEKGGVVGICLYKEFISKKANLDFWIKHVDYFVNKFGTNNLCIGTDFYGAKNFINRINNYQKLSKIVEKLFKIGYNIKVIEKIFFSNAQNYVKTILKYNCNGIYHKV